METKIQTFNDIPPELRDYFSSGKKGITFLIELTKGSTVEDKPIKKGVDTVLPVRETRRLMERTFQRHFHRGMSDFVLVSAEKKKDYVSQSGKTKSHWVLGFLPRVESEILYYRASFWDLGL